VAGAAALVSAPTPATAQNIQGPVTASAYASGLSGPHGMAFHPQSGELYVVEKEAGRISVIRNGRATPVVETGWTVAPDFPSWAVSDNRSAEFIQDPALHSPGAIAFSPDGHLFVAEDRAYGRILEFIPDESGAFAKAQYVPVPWIDKPFAWDDLAATADGQLIVVGYDHAGDAGLHFGSVLLRDKQGDWWVVDYGPFSQFAAVVLSRNSDILVVCERSKGELVAWDIQRHMVIGTVAESVFQAQAETVTLLKDGAYVVGQIAAPGAPPAKGSSRMVRIDPMTSQETDLASGFDRIGGSILEKKTGSIYVSDAAAGTIVKLDPNPEIIGREYLLQRSLETFEIAQGFTPRTAPVFLNNFISKLGAPPSADQSRTQQGGAEDGQEDVLYGSSFTLRDLATKIPMVAGKVRTLVEEDDPNPDPVMQIEFLLLFPAHVVKSTDMATPSLSFFSAVRKSGKMEQSRLLFQGYHAKQRVGDQWMLQSDNASIYVPLATCGIERKEDGMDLNLAFLGMGFYDDYYLRLVTGKENSGRLMVEGKFGAQSEYNLSFVDAPRMGGEIVKNLYVGGFDPAVQSQQMGWLNIGQWPVGQALAVDTEEVFKFAGVDEEITAAIEQKELERRMSVGSEAAAVGDGAATDAAATGAEPGPAPAPDASATPEVAPANP